MILCKPQSMANNTLNKMDNNTWTSIYAFFKLFGWYILAVVMGAFGSLFMNNKDKRLGFWENMAVFFSSSIVGTTWAMVCYSNKWEGGVAFTSVVTLMGYQIANNVTNIVKDPKKFNKLFMDFVRKIVAK